MKQILLLIALFFSFSIFAQSPPEAINYQAVARNVAGVPMVNQSISVQYAILQGSSSGTVVYSETHAETTNQFGLFTSEIGLGSVNSGNFSTINWGSSIFYLQVTVDGDVMPATQLLSVPYALHAKTATSGVPGVDGHNSLISSVAEPAGVNCTNGGYFIQSWLDLNDDGLLSSGETPISYYICNGADGANGLNGNDGVGIDSTIHNADGTLTIYYSNSTTYTTNDLTGPAGSGGTTYFAGNGISLLGDTIINIGDGDADSSNELQVLSISNDTLFLSNGNNVVLPSLSETITSIQDNGDGTYTYTDELGLQEVINANIDDADADPLNEIQTISTSGTLVPKINISNGGGSINIVGTGGTDVSEVGNTITINSSNTSYTAGTGIDVTTNVITNTAPDQVVLLQQAGATTVTGTYPNFTISSTDNVNDADSDPTNEIELPATATTNQVLTWNGSAWVAQNPGSGADNWGSQTAITDGSSITGNGTAGSPITLSATIPTNTSDLTNDSGFITNANDADSDPTNEIELPATASTNDVLTWNGSAWVAGVSPADGDSDPNNEIELPATASTGDVLVWNGSMWVAGVDQTADGDTDATNEIELPATASTNDVLIWNGSAWIAGTTPADGDGNSTNEIQNISIAGNAVGISGGGTGFDLSSNNPTTGDMLYFNGVSWIAQPVPADNDNQDLSSSVSGSDVTINITGGNSASFNIDDADSDSTNEIQTLTFASPNLTLSNGGGTVDLSGLSSATYWSQTGNNIYPTTLANNVGIGFASPTARLQIDNNATARSVDLNNYLNSASNTHVVFGNNAGTGSGDKFGTQMTTTGAGGNSNYGIYGSASNATGSNFGLYGSASSSGTSTAHGVYTSVNGGGTGANYAVYATNSSTSSGASYAGIFNNYSSTGSIIYGVRAQVSGNAGGATSKYGLRADVSGTAPVNYGGYFNAIGGATNWAGYFANGDVYIQNRLVLPTGASNNYVLKSDASGNASWADISSLSPASLWSKTGNNVYPTTLSDNIGIGTNSPNMKLHIASSIINDGALHVVNENAGPTTSVGGTKGARISVTSDGTEQKFGLEVELSGVGSGQQNAIFAQALGASTGSYNRGIVAAASNSSVSNIAADLFADGDAGVNYGLRVFTGGTQTSSKYAAYLTSSGSGTKYGLYSVGEDINYFSGAVGIGINSPSEALDVDNGGSIEVDGEYTYESPKTHYYTLSAKDFVGGSPHNGDNWNNTGNIIYSYFDVTGNSFPIANAGFQIPDGARITDITAFIWDDDGSITYQPRFMVYEVLMASGSYGLVGTATLASDAASVQQLSIPLNKVVDNVNRSYHIKFQSAGDAGSNIRLYGVRITYTVDKAD
jgi:hypothetical protein